MPLPTEAQIIIKTLELLKSAVETVKNGGKGVDEALKKAYGLTDQFEAQAEEAKKTINAAPAIHDEAQKHLYDAQAANKKAQDLLVAAKATQDAAADKASKDALEVAQSLFYHETAKKDYEDKTAALKAAHADVLAKQGELEKSQAEAAELIARYNKKIELMEHSKAI